MAAWRTQIFSLHFLIHKSGSFILNKIKILLKVLHLTKSGRFTFVSLKRFSMVSVFNRMIYAQTNVSVSFMVLKTLCLPPDVSVRLWRTLLL